MVKSTYDEPTVLARFAHRSGLCVELIVVSDSSGFILASVGLGKLISAYEFSRIEDVVEYVSGLKVKVVARGFICVD